MNENRIGVVAAASTSGPGRRAVQHSTRAVTSKSTNTPHEGVLTARTTNSRVSSIFGNALARCHGERPALAR